MPTTKTPKKKDVELRANHHCWVNAKQRNEIKRIAQRMHAQPAIIPGARTIIFDGSDVLDTIQSKSSNDDDRLTFPVFKAALIEYVNKRTKITPDRLSNLELTVRDLEERLEKLEGVEELDAKKEEQGSGFRRKAIGLLRLRRTSATQKGRCSKS